MDRGDLQNAGALLEEASAIDRELENQAGLAEDLDTRFTLYQLTGNYAGAAQSLSRAFYLRASLNDRQGLERDIALLRESSRRHGHPENMSPYEAVYKNPELFDPLKQYCP